MTTLYTPRQMLAAMRERPAPDSFLRSRLVTGAPIISDKKEIELDKYTAKQGIAVYNSRTGGPTEVSKKSASTDLHVSPYVFESITMTPSDVDTRELGETIYESDAVRTSNSRQVLYMEELNQRLDRLEEKQIVEAITAGTVTVANAAAGVSYTVTYGMDDDNKNTLTGNDVWGGSTANIVGNIESMGQRLMEKGYVGTDLLLDVTAAGFWRADTDLQALLNNRRIQMGTLEPRVLAGQRVSYLGTLDAVGVNVDVWCYLGGYETADDTFSYYFDTNRAIMIGNGVEIQQHYGKLENFRAGFRGRRFPQMIMDNYGKRVELTMESAPLAILRNPNAIVSWKVGA